MSAGNERSTDRQAGGSHPEEQELKEKLRRLEEAVDELAHSARDTVGQRAARLAEDLEQRARRLRRQLEGAAETHGDRDEAPGMVTTAKRSNGWLRDLYRDPDRAWLAGVCAGLARYFGVEPWVVRLVAISLFLFNAFLMFWAYVAGVVLLARRPRDNGKRYVSAAIKASDRSPAPELGSRLAPRPGMRSLRLRFADMEARTRRMEGYVTSREFTLQREIAGLERDAAGGTQ
ncbi:MAG: PspC domain-containing protein [Gammaproteobacteria bacterium]|nr:PspC domain-containing protein [Gammaproteobacteria bacterium]